MAQKYIPPGRRGGVKSPSFPSTAIYSREEVARCIPGESAHTFCREALDPTRADSQAPPSMDDGTHCEVEGEKHLSLFSSQFCRIMVYKGGHVNPPCELWTRSNIGALDVNVGKPIPLFEEFPSTGKTRFEFKGWYEIVRWTVFKGGSPEIVEFMQRRGDSKRSKDAWRWREALGSSWAKVEVVPVHDDALGNPMQRVATSQAA